MASKMFGFSRNGGQNVVWWDKFNWTTYAGEDIVVRPILSFGDTWYDKSFLHSILGNLYAHTNDNCNLCDKLFSNEKYTKLQESIVRLKVPTQFTKDKWGYVIQTLTSVRIMGLLAGNPKPVLIQMYNDLANQFLNIVESKENLSSATISDLTNGSPVKIQFKKLEKFPYRAITNVTVGNPKALPDDVIEKLHSFPEFDQQPRTASDDEADEIINEWYSKTTAFMRKWNTQSSNAAPNLDMSTIGNEVDFNTALKNITHSTNPSDDIDSEEIPF